MLQLSANDFEPFSQACIEGSLDITVFVDDIRRLESLTVEQKHDHKVVADACECLAELFNSAISAAEAINAANQPSLAARHFLRFMKAPSSAYKVQAPREMSPNIAGRLVLSFSSMHELVEFAAAALLDVASDLREMLTEGVEGKRRVVYELLEIAEERLVSLTHEDDKPPRNSEYTVCEERLDYERAALHLAMRGERAELSINSADEYFGDVVHPRTSDATPDSDAEPETLPMGFKKLEVQGFYKRNGSTIEIRNHDQLKLFQALLQAFPNRVPRKKICLLMKTQEERDRASSRLRTILQGVGVTCDRYTLAEWDGR